MQQFGICVYFALSVQHEHRFCLAVNIWLIQTFLTMATVSDAVGEHVSVTQRAEKEKCFPGDELCDEYKTIQPSFGCTFSPWTNVVYINNTQ